jgi:hypothetical protein
VTSCIDAADSFPPTASECTDRRQFWFRSQRLLAFAERQELAKSRRQRAPSITTGFGVIADEKGVKADMPLNTRRNSRTRPI